MMNYLILALFGLVLLLALLLFAMRQVEEEKQQAKPRPHVHRWRQITEFARQCDDRACAALEVQDSAPDGMPRYLALMTSTRAREHPIEESQLYASMAPEMNTVEGTVCADCERIYPKHFPWCPFCDKRPIPHMIFDEHEKVFTIATEAAILRIEQERRERIKTSRVQQQSKPLIEGAAIESSDCSSERADR